MAASTESPCSPCCPYLAWWWHTCMGLQPVVLPSWHPTQSYVLPRVWVLFGQYWAHSLPVVLAVMLAVVAPPTHTLSLRPHLVPLVCIWWQWPWAYHWYTQIVSSFWHILLYSCYRGYCDGCCIVWIVIPSCYHPICSCPYPYSYPYPYAYWPCAVRVAGDSWCAWWIARSSWWSSAWAATGSLMPIRRSLSSPHSLCTPATTSTLWIHSSIGYSHCCSRGGCVCDRILSPSPAVSACPHWGPLPAAWVGLSSTCTATPWCPSLWLRYGDCRPHCPRARHSAPPSCTRPSRTCSATSATT